MIIISPKFYKCIRDQDKIILVFSCETNLVYELHPIFYHLVGMILVLPPSGRRIEFINRKVVHQWLHVLEEPDEVFQEFICVTSRCVIQTSDTFFEEKCPYAWIQANSSTIYWRRGMGIRLGHV